MARKVDTKNSALFPECSPRQKKTDILKVEIHLHSGLPPLDLNWLSEIANSPAKDAGYTRTFYSYPAKFQAQLPHQLVATATNPGDLVCDPYCGGGTTGLESMLLNRRFVGYDLSPFAILVSRVKTTRVDTRRIQEALPRLLKINFKASANVFDEGDIECIGNDVANEVNCLYENISTSGMSNNEKSFLKLALIHTVKIIGRRDFTASTHRNDDILFKEIPNITILHLFEGKVKKMLSEINTIPKNSPQPKFYCASNYQMKLDSQSVDLVVTSPPYKDLDIEYGLIQLQRREINRSKRSKVIWKILNTRLIAKDKLCGGRGISYWEGLEGSLIECHRVMKKRRLAFFWIGFKTDSDQKEFCLFLKKHGLPAEHLIPVRLGDDRVASSRSTHHGRDTGMMEKDYLIVARCA